MMVMDRLLSTENLVRLQRQREIEFIDTAEGALGPGADKKGPGPLDSDYVLLAGQVRRITDDL